MTLVYETVTVKVHTKQNNIEKIVYNDNEIIFEWDMFSEQLIVVGSDLLSSLDNTPYHNMDISGLSVTCLDTKSNFIRGLSITLVLQRLIREKYIRISSLPDDYSIFTVNNMRVLKMALIFHLKIVDEDDRLLKHCLDFVNRWSCLFHRGDKVDKLEVMTELVVRYLAKNENKVVENSPNLEQRVRRIESVLGINF